MGFFTSNGRIERAYLPGIDHVRATIQQVAAENAHHVQTISPDGSRLELVTARTAFNWGTALNFTLHGSSAGTQLVVDYDNVPGSPVALLDGRKNRKTVDAFMSLLDARLGQRSA